MKYTAKQIENAKRKYNEMLVMDSLENYNLDVLTRNEANQRVEMNNKIVTQILNGNKEVEKEWKLFFLREEVKADQKKSESLAKKNSNKDASSDILAPIKSAKRMVEFGKWLNTAGNPFRKQHFNKKYTVEAVNEFLSLAK